MEGRGLSENGTARALQQERYWDRLEQSGATFVRINVLWGPTENYQAPGQEWRSLSVAPGVDPVLVEIRL